MYKGRSIVVLLSVLAGSWTPVVSQTKPGGYILERDADVAKAEPGTHKGGGETIGYSFFAKAQARPNPTIPATLSVPARRPYSCAPP